ncbi:MAG: ABC transporter ATP-binding protein [Bacillota bacterium]|nr:ABC transporter ATP-binding protein [Bacillota bacterium]
MEEIITGKNIFKSYEENSLVLKDINISIKKGEFLVVMGPSGSGKSTLLYALSTMDTIDQGQIIFADENISDLDEEALATIRRKQMGFVFQNPSFLKNLNIIDNIILPALNDKSIKKADLRKKAKNLLEKVGLQGLGQREISKVSGGQLQRASICRALINDPLIIFADEPTGSLNSKSTEEIIDLFNKINDQGTTIMLVSHDPKVALKSHRVVFMKDGSLVDQILLLGLKDQDKEKLLQEKMKVLDI